MIADADSPSVPPVVALDMVHTHTHANGSSSSSSGPLVTDLLNRQDGSNGAHRADAANADKVDGNSNCKEHSGSTETDALPEMFRRIGRGSSPSGGGGGSSRQLSAAAISPPYGPSARAPVDRDSEVYNMNHRRRGVAFLFNHMHFDDRLGLKQRNGTNADRDNLRLTLRALDFEVRVFNDLPFKVSNTRLLCGVFFKSAM